MEHFRWFAGDHRIGALPVALLVPVITAILLWDGLLSRFDGFLMLGLFMAWLTAAVMEARRQRSIAGEIPDAHRGWQTVLFCIIGLGC